MCMGQLLFDIVSQLEVGDTIQQCGKDWQYGIKMTVTELNPHGFSYTGPGVSGYAPYLIFIDDYFNGEIYDNRVRLGKRIVRSTNDWQDFKNWVWRVYNHPQFYLG